MTRSEYEAKFAANQRISGQGVGNVYVHMPCPFCAEPDFMVYELLASQDAMSKGATCKACRRGIKAIFSRSPSGVSFEIVQTCGDTAPDYVPPMRRVEN